MKINSRLTINFVVPNPPGTRILCDAEIKDQPAGWRLRRGYGNHCQRHAVYIINGEELCRLHAGDRVLDLLMKDHPSLHYIKSNVPRLQRKP